MKKTTILSWTGAAAMMLAASLPASAVDAEPTFIPEQGEVTAEVLSGVIKMQCAQNIDFYPGNNDITTATKETFQEGVRLTGPDGEVPIINWCLFNVSKARRYNVNNNPSWEYDAAKDVYNLFPSSEAAANSIEFKFQAVTTPGTYTLTIAADTFVVGSGEANNDAITATWTVVAGEVKNPFETYTITPESGTTALQLKDFHVTYTAGLGEMLIADPEITLTGGATPFTTANVEKDADAKGFTVYFDEAITAEGDYTLNIPAGLFKAAEGDFETTAIEATYKLEPRKANVLDNYELTPAAGSEVKYEKFNYNFKVTFPDATVDLDDYSSMDYSAAVLKDKETGKEYTATTAASSWTGVGFTVTFQQSYVGYPDIPAGEYTLLIPAGFWKDKDGNLTPEITADYTILPEVPSPFSKFVVTPSTDESLTELSEVQITFPNITADQTVTINTSLFTYLTLSTETESIMAVSAVQSQTEAGKTITITFEKAATNGTYTLSIPAEIFTLGAETNKVMAFNYVIKSTSVETLGAENGPADVYDLSGRTVLRAADAEALGTLDAGLYIINGKKVIIRK